jgi:hypothetical protein
VRRLFPFFFMICFFLVCFAGCINSNTQQKFPDPNRTITSTTSGSYSSFLTGQPAFSNGSIITDSVWISIDPVNDHIIGDSIIITGNTNLSSQNKILVQVFPKEYISRHFYDCVACHESELGKVARAGDVIITPGKDGINHWVFIVNSSEFVIDESPISYDIDISSSDFNRTSTLSVNTKFNLSKS